MSGGWDCSLSGEGSLQVAHAASTLTASQDHHIPSGCTLYPSYPFVVCSRTLRPHPPAAPSSRTLQTYPASERSKTVDNWKDCLVNMGLRKICYPPGWRGPVYIPGYRGPVCTHRYRGPVCTLKWHGPVYTLVWRGPVWRFLSNYSKPQTFYINPKDEQWCAVN